MVFKKGLSRTEQRPSKRMSKNIAKRSARNEPDFCETQILALYNLYIQETPGSSQVDLTLTYTIPTLNDPEKGGF